MRRPFIKIGGKKIGYGQPVFIIAEAGVNHNQNLDLALKLVDVAAASGADAVKFQTFRAEDVVVENAQMAPYQKKNIGVEKSQYEMLRDLELPENFYKPLIERCKRRGILFMSTPHGGKKSVDFLENLTVEAYKIGSGDLTNYILLERIAKTHKPIILSSGMANLDEVKDAIRFIKSKGNHQISMLHCTTNYPCPPQDVNLLAMKTMINDLDVPVGYSDHTQESQVAIMAATLGMTIYECHFTLDKNLSGPDHIASAEPNELKERIEAIRKVRVILGTSQKRPTSYETSSMRKIARKSIVAAGNLDKGHTISDEDIEAKRPGDGVSPVEFEKIIGKKLKKSIRENQKIKFKDLEND